MLRVVYTVVHLIVQRRADLLAATSVADMHTGGMTELREAEEHHVWVLQQLGLSPQQLKRMVNSFHVYKRLLAPVLQEVRQLQQEIGGSTSSCGGSEGSGGGSFDGSVHTSLIGTVIPVAAADDAIRLRMAAAQLQQQQARWLSTLMHKDYLIKMCCGVHVVGCMTWTQVGRLLVLLSPHPATANMLCNAAERLWQQQQDNQQQA